VERHGITNLAIVGDVFSKPIIRAIDERAAAGAPYDVRSLRRIYSSGAMWSAEVKQGLLDRMPNVALNDIMNSSEGAMATQVTTHGTTATTALFVLNPTTKVFTEDGREVVPGSDEVGMLAAPVVAGAGYEGDEEKTDAAFKDIDGVRYSIPGDMARYGADGRLVLLGRGSSVINTGGEKVYADEVELVLRDHPAVRDAVVLGVPDPTWGSVVAAVVALVDGVEAGEDELAGFVAERLASYKKPRRIALVPEVQRLNTGKSDLGWAKARFAPPVAR
jgi:fatty-acyl-CoA synthase